MNLNDYQTKALRTANPRDRKNELFHLLLGLCGEAGEIAEKTKKTCPVSQVLSGADISLKASLKK